MNFKLNESRFSQNISGKLRNVTRIELTSILISQAFLIIILSIYIKYNLVCYLIYN